MSHPNRLSRIIHGLQRLPEPARRRAVSLLMGNLVPFVGNARMVIEQMSNDRVAVRVANRRRNRNHIGQVHAAAMALAAETASGFVVGMNVPDNRLPLMKSLQVNFKKRTRGDIRAVATLDESQLEAIAQDDKGEVSVQVQVTDETGAEPVECEMIWAWIPRKS